MPDSDQRSDRADEPTARSDETTAERVVVSHSPALSDTARRRLEKRSFRSYLRRTRDEARTGDVWEEFVGVGCGATCRCASNASTAARKSATRPNSAT